MTIKRIKDAAALISALAGIVTGIEKIRVTVIKWSDEISTAHSKRKLDKEFDNIVVESTKVKPTGSTKGPNFNKK